MVIFIMNNEHSKIDGIFETYDLHIQAIEISNAGYHVINLLNMRFILKSDLMGIWKDGYFMAFFRVICIFKL